MKKYFMIALLLLVFMPVLAYAGDSELNVSRGQVYNARQIYVFGSSDTISTSLIPVGDTLSVNFPSAAAILNIVSTSASDEVSETGARTVKVSGLNANGLEQSETVSMAGTTAVVTVNTYLRVNSIQVASAGSVTYNIGIIYVFTGYSSSGTPGDATLVYRMILAQKNRSLNASYSVPNNCTAYLTDESVSCTGTDETMFVLKTRDRSATIPIQIPIDVINIKAHNVDKNYSYPIVIKPKTDIVFYAKNLRDTSGASASFQLRLEKQ